jgi:head-tail adaptor
MAKTPAGDRDTRITFERFSTSQDNYGEQVEAWSEIGSSMAKVFYGRGDERRQAAREQASKQATFNVGQNAVTRSLTEADRIKIGAVIWDIIDITPLGKSEIDFTASRAKP